MAALALAGKLVDEVESIDRIEVSRLFAHDAEPGKEWRAFVSSADEVISLLNDPDGIVRDNLVRAGARRVIYGSPLVGSGHAADWLMRPLAEIAIPITFPALPRLRLPEDHVARGRRRLLALTGDTGRKVLVIHPGSGSPKKNWPADRFATLARRLRDECSYVPVFVLGEADSIVMAELAGVAPEIAVLTGCDLLEVASMLVACQGYVGNDSGITHLAASLGIPTVALFGPSDPAIWGPRGENVRVIRSEGPTGASIVDLDLTRVFDCVSGHMAGHQTWPAGVLTE